MMAEMARPVSVGCLESSSLLAVRVVVVVFLVLGGKWRLGGVVCRRKRVSSFRKAILPERT